jgi:hypothetical protein
LLEGKNNLIKWQALLNSERCSHERKSSLIFLMEPGNFNHSEVEELALRSQVIPFFPPYSYDLDKAEESCLEDSVF